MLDRIKNILKAEFNDQFEDLFGERDKLEDMELDELLKRFTGKSHQTDQGQKYQKQHEHKSSHRQGGFSAKTSKEREYYGHLELPVGASFEEIKKSYRKLMKIYHPDLYGSDPENTRWPKRFPKNSTKPMCISKRNLAKARIV